MKVMEYDTPIGSAAQVLSDSVATNDYNLDSPRVCKLMLLIAAIHTYENVLQNKPTSF